MVPCEQPASAAAKVRMVSQLEYRHARLSRLAIKELHARARTHACTNTPHLPSNPRSNTQYADARARTHTHTHYHTNTHTHTILHSQQYQRTLNSRHAHAAEETGRPWAAWRQRARAGAAAAARPPGGRDGVGRREESRGEHRNAARRTWWVHAHASGGAVTAPPRRATAAALAQRR